MTGKKLTKTDKRTIFLLGLPSFGLALSSTVAVTYTPLIARQFISSTAIVGSIIAIEGLVALFLPVLAGTWSDHLRSKVGGRLPFMIAGLPVMALSLILLGTSRSITELITCLVLFFLAYYLAYEPYRALYPDLIHDHAAGRAQSVQAMWRGIGTGFALIGGGFLLTASSSAPYIMAMGLTLVSSFVFLWITLKRQGVPKQNYRHPETIKGSYVDAIRILKEQPKLRAYLVANSLWELTLAALKSFIILFLTVGLGKSKAIAATLISVTAIVMFIAAPISGRLGDRYGKVRVSQIAALVFGLGLLMPILTHSVVAMALIIPIAGFGGAAVLTLPYAILMPMMPDDQHGKLTGLYSTSRGVGIMAGPLLAGGAISLLGHDFSAHGYSAMFLVCAAAMLLSILPLRYLD